MGLARMPARDAALAIHRLRYRKARTILVGGSVARGDETPESDLDLVVLYDRVEQAHADAFVFEGWPVETFVHDAETLRYTMWSFDRFHGRSDLADMVAESIELPAPTTLGALVKGIASEILAGGAPPLMAHELQGLRYNVTHLVQDLRSARPREDHVAVGARLYEQLTTLYLRAHGAWLMYGKRIPRELRKIDASFAERFVAGFAALFERGETGPALAVAEEVLSAYGGPHFDAGRVDSPAHWRLARLPFTRQALLGAELRSKELTLDDLEAVGRERYGDAGHLALYGMPPREWYGRGARIVGRTAAECCTDVAAALASAEAQAIKQRHFPNDRPVVVDPFAGSGNLAIHIGRAVEACDVVCIEADAAVATRTARNFDLLGIEARLLRGDALAMLATLQIPDNTPVVVMVHQPWGTALSPMGELDLRRTDPPIDAILDAICTAFAGRRLAVMIHSLPYLVRDSLAPLRARFSSCNERVLTHPESDHRLHLVVCTSAS